MSQDELNAIIKARSDKEEAENKRSWEQTRSVCFYAVVAMQGTKNIKKPEDIFQLPWDKKRKK